MRSWRRILPVCQLVEDLMSSSWHDSIKWNSQSRHAHCDHISHQFKNWDTKSGWPHDLRGLADTTKVGLLLLSKLELLKGQLGQAPNPEHHGKVHCVSEPWTPGVQSATTTNLFKFKTNTTTLELVYCRWMQLVVHMKICCTSTVVHRSFFVFGQRLGESIH